MKISDAAAFICADCSLIDHGNCDLTKALQEFDSAPWRAELKIFDEMDGKQPTPCWPDLSFRIGKYHICYMLETDGENFQVEVCMPPKKKFLGIFNFAKFFEIRNVAPFRAKEYLRKFYTLSHSDQYEYFSQENARRT